METFLGKVASYLLENYQNNLSEITVVFPNRRAGLFLKREFAERITKTIWLPKITTIEEALQNWTGFQLSDPLNLRLELLKIHHQLFPNDLQSISEFSGYAELFINDFDEIDQYLVDSQKLYTYLSQAKALELWHIDGTDLRPSEIKFLAFYQSIHDYYSALKNNLTIKKSGYQGMLARMLAELDVDALIKKIGSEKIIFAGFNALTPAEEKIILGLQKENKAELLWDIDSYYLKANNFELPEAGYFIRKHLSNHHKNDPIHWISDNLLTQSKKITITAVPGNVGQCKVLGNNLVNQANFEQTAVVLADENLLIPAINSIPENVGKYNVTMGLPFSKSIIYNFIMKLFEIQDVKTNTNPKNELYLWSLLRLLDHDFFSQILHDQAFNTLKKIRQSLAKSGKLFVQSADILLDNPANNELLSFLNQIIEPWENSSVKGLKQIQNILEISILFAKSRKGNETNFLLLNQFSAGIRICNRLAALVSENESLIDLKSIKMIIKQIAPSYAINFFGEPLSGLQLMGLLESRNLDFKTLHILSVNEGCLPAEKHNNSFIPFDIRQSFSLPTYSHKQAVFAYHFFRLLQSPENIFIYYNTESGELGGGEKSRFILQLCKELASLNPKIEIEEKISIIPLNEAVLNDPIEGIKTPEILQKIKFKAVKGFSASSLSTYLGCQLKFYFVELLEIREQTEEDEIIGSNTIGNILHLALKQLYEGKLNQKLDKTTYIDSEKYLFNAFKKETNLPIPELGKNKLIYEVIKKMWEDFINHEQQLLSQNNDIFVLFVEKYYENLSTIEIDNEPLIWKLKGTIDRIDHFGSSIRIIDYKTGKVKENDVSIKDFNIESFEKKPKALQLVIYYYLYLKNNPTLSVEVIQTGIYKLLRSEAGLQQLIFPQIIDNQDILTVIEDLLVNIVSEIFNPEINFSQTNNHDNCSYCSFIELCNRQSKKDFN